MATRHTILASLFLLAMCCAPSRARAEFVKISEHFSIHYRKSGHGPIPIVFVPGWAMSAAVFQKQLAHFQDSRRFTFITLDPRSQGLTTHTATGNYYPQHGRDLKAFLDKLHLDNIILAGWSYGVFDVMTYINQFGAGNVRGVVIIDGTPKCSGLDNSKEWVWFRYDDSDHYKRSFTLGALTDRTAANAQFADWMLEKPTPAARRWVSGIADQTPDEVAALTNETCAYLDYSQDLMNLEGKMPLLFVIRDEWGEVVQSWVKSHTPSATLKIMGKHMMFWERADEFNATLDAFLSPIR
jgi:non-heme chloroperoxidase